MNAQNNGNQDFQVTNHTDSVQDAQISSINQKYPSYGAPKVETIQSTPSYSNINTTINDESPVVGATASSVGYKSAQMFGFGNKQN